MIVIVATLIVGCGVAGSRSAGLGPQPQSFTWDYAATSHSATPQEAFATAMKLTPCIGAPDGTPGYGAAARTTTVTWIVSAPRYGLARIQPICDPSAQPYHIWLFEIIQGDDQEWHPEGGYLAGHWTANSNILPRVPGWLPLPADTYVQHLVDAPTGICPAASVIVWDAQTRFFVLGHITDHAIRPNSATSVTVDGNSGWMVTESGLTTVTMELADGTTLFFSGTAMPSQVRLLAVAAFAHESTVLPPLRCPTTSPSSVH